MAKLLLTFVLAGISAIRVSDDDKEELFSIKNLLSTTGEFDQQEFNKILIRKDGLNHILLSDAEKIIKDKIETFIKSNSTFFEEVGAKAVQGQAYLPGKDE